MSLLSLNTKKSVNIVFIKHNNLLFLMISELDIYAIVIFHKFQHLLSDTGIKRTIRSFFSDENLYFPLK